MIVAAHRLSAVSNCDQLLDLGEMVGAVKANYGLR
jgi:ABC-type multidrug transport system fused ATPase/permease subunit